MNGKQMYPCPGCGKVREARGPESECQSCRGSGKKLNGDNLTWAVAHVRERRAAEATASYIERRIQTHPWLTIAEAANELDVTQGRISQLIKDGTLTHRTVEGSTWRKYVSAADVYAYTPSPEKKTRTKIQ